MFIILLYYGWTRMKDEKGKLSHTNIESKIYLRVCVCMCEREIECVCNLDSLYMKLTNKAHKNGTIYQKYSHFSNPKTRQLIPKVLPVKKRREWSDLSLHVGMLGHGSSVLSVGCKMNSLRKCKLSVHFTYCRDSTCVFLWLYMLTKHSICSSKYNMRKTVSRKRWKTTFIIRNVSYFTCHIIACPSHIETTLVREV